jgi:hypothetical protein
MLDKLNSPGGHLLALYLLFLSVVVMAFLKVPHADEWAGQLFLAIAVVLQIRPNGGAPPTDPPAVPPAAPAAA